ncbi:MAG: hypothetical protein HY908_04500 [Myxococcales bacterium]|nr:hypothetical protein [Myxococcales bacterium]
MSLPQPYVEAIVGALAALRAPAPTFAPRDVELVFGPTPPPGVALPATTTRADCATWLGGLAAEHLKLLAEHLLGLGPTERAAITAFVQFEQVARASSLAALEALVVVDRTRLLGNLRELRDGVRPLMRVWGDRGTGKSFTTDVMEEVLGVNIGGDQRVVEIDLASYTEEPVRHAVEDILRACDLACDLPAPGDVTPQKYLEQLGQVVVRKLLDAATGAGRAWIVFDRCAVASETPDLAAFLGHVAAHAKKLARDRRCPRIVFLEAEADLFKRYRTHMVEEVLGAIEPGDIAAFLGARGVPPARHPAVLQSLALALADLDGRERLEEMQLQLDELLAGDGT